ncbi:MAG: maltooligosyl trehalose hydrolase, partial [Nocardioides sp.]|uniref:malto-oligosyltrehalose trehalohydrolase n=1 Tax=Nocardioides sp. TaxID=35761 RepID=UPI00261AC5E5
LDRLLGLVPLPDAGFGNLLWQAILGAWPARGLDLDLRERLHGYAEKAMREAGDRTTWTAPDKVYEAAVHAAVDAALDRPDVRAVLDEVLAAVTDAGWSNSLAAKLVAITMPGVPDVYQGSELWEQSLVDPDNRRPVDFGVRTSMLASVEQGERPQLAGGVDDPGGAKMLVTRAGLRARRDQPELFTSYAPVAADGEAARHVLAFDRGGAITVATRLPLGLAARGGWGDTSLVLPAGEWTDACSGRTFSGDAALSEVLGELPVALLTRGSAPLETTHGRFDVWAPRARSMTLQVGDQRIAMSRGTDDWWAPAEPAPEGEVDYGYLIDDAEQPVPDPRSRRQPDGVHGLSRTFDAGAHDWTDTAWTGRQLAGSVIYELHVGTFTPEGTFDAALARLEHLKSIGVDFVEILPVNAFNGTHNWGYDGVLWSAVHEGYGGPAAYQRFVDGCHAAGIGVIQDVVHNHLGPSGNYLPVFGPYLKVGANTWGDLINLDGEGSHEVRRFILDSVRMWFTDMHVDGLRLDAVHALSDDSPTHLLEEMAREVAALSAHQRRPLTLIAESDLNDPSLVTPREGGGYGLDAQWSDDFHHAVHVALTGETEGYYADFEPLSALGKVLTKGFFHDGTFSSFRNRPHGVPFDVDRMPAWRLVVASQNHDQIGNRARGDRITEALDDDQLACAALLTLASPFTPMLFQGEEWAASSPFAFFTSHPEPELGRATAEGRLEEFERMGWDPAVVPDPQDRATFERSKLDWDEVGSGRHAVLLEVYRRLATLRRELPELTDPDLRRVEVDVDERARILVMRRAAVTVVVNFGGADASVGLPGEHEVLFATPSGASTAAGHVDLPAHAGALLRRTR